MAFYHVQNELYFNKQTIVETDVVNDVMCTRKCYDTDDHTVFKTE